jgi:hypothetical protein
MNRGESGNCSRSDPGIILYKMICKYLLGDAKLQSNFSLQNSAILCNVKNKRKHTPISKD